MSEASFIGAGDTNANGPNARVSRTLSRFHTPHRFTLFGVYQSPFFNRRKDFVGQLLGGWNISGVWRFAHGTPFTIINRNGFGDITLTDSPKFVRRWLTRQFWERASTIRILPFKVCRARLFAPRRLPISVAAF